METSAGKSELKSDCLPRVKDSEMPPIPEVKQAKNEEPMFRCQRCRWTGELPQLHESQWTICPHCGAPLEPNREIVTGPSFVPMPKEGMKQEEQGKNFFVKFQKKILGQLIDRIFKEGKIVPVGKYTGLPMAAEEVMAEMKFVPWTLEQILTSIDQGVCLGGFVEEDLTFDQLREANVTRCEQVFHLLDDWSACDWAVAMAGECEETCNTIKKQRRGDPVAIETIADELADMVIYADLLAARLRINLGLAVRRKFNRVSEEKNCKVKI